MTKERIGGYKDDFSRPMIQIRAEQTKVPAWFYVQQNEIAAVVFSRGARGYRKGSLQFMERNYGIARQDGDVSRKVI